MRFDSKAFPHLNSQWKLTQPIMYIMCISFNFKMYMQSAVGYSNSVTWGQYVHGCLSHNPQCHNYTDVIMGAIASQITNLTIVYSTVYSDAYQRKNQSSASLAFVWGIHRWPVNSPHKWPITRKIFPFDNVIMTFLNIPSIFPGLCHAYWPRPLSFR